MKAPAPAKANENDSLSRQSEERGRSSSTPPANPIRSSWPSVPIPVQSSSPIQPGQRSASPPDPSPSTWKVKHRDPGDYERDRMGKYADFFVGNEILPIPGIMDKIEPRIVSLVVTDIKTKRLVGLKRENFEETLSIRRPLPVFLP